MQGRLHVASSQSADRQLKVTQRVHKGAILLPVEAHTCITPGPCSRYADEVLAPTAVPWTGGACTHFHAFWVSMCGPCLTPGAMGWLLLQLLPLVSNKHMISLTPGAMVHMAKVALRQATLL